MQRNALVQRDNALVTRWWSLKSMNTNANALVEFAFHGDNALRSFFKVANALMYSWFGKLKTLVSGEQ